MPPSSIPPLPPVATYRDPAGMAILNQNADLFPPDVLSNIIKVNPEQYRFLTVVSRFGQNGKGETIRHPYQYDWVVQRENATKATINATVAVGGTTLTFVAGDTSRLTTSQNLRNTRTGETVRLSFASADITSTTTANVVRSVGAIAAQEMLAGDELVILGSSRTEASADPVPTGIVPTRANNYVSELSRTSGATLAMMNSDQYGGWSPKGDALNVADLFRADVENELLFSEQEYLVASDGYPLTRTQGLISALSTNVQTLTSTPDWPTFLNVMYPSVRYGKGGVYGSRIKHLFVSNSWARWFDSLPQQHIVVNDPHTKQVDGLDSGISWGWQVRKVLLSGCYLMIHVMPHWDDYTGAALNMAQAALCIDANHIGVRYKPQGQIKPLPARSAGGGRAPVNVTYETSCWHFWGGLVYDFEAAHSLTYCTTL
jgi:hypothetical protein